MKFRLNYCNVLIYAPKNKRNKSISFIIGRIENYRLRVHTAFGDHMMRHFLEQGRVPCRAGKFVKLDSKRSKGVPQHTHPFKSVEYIVKKTLYFENFLQ